MSGVSIPRAIIDGRLRTDFRFFLHFVFASLHNGKTVTWGWHLDALCHHLNLARLGETRRLLITIPPRHLKSITVSVAFVAWMMGRDPSLKFLVASYGGELSSDLAGLFRTAVSTAGFKSAFPRFKLARNREGEIRTTRGGVLRAVSVGGATTGFGADYIIVDDLMKPTEANSPAQRQAAIDYFRGTLISRLNDQAAGRIIVVGQRLHEEDVAGVCIEMGLYTHLNLPAIAQRDELVPIGRGKVHPVRTGDVLYYPQDELDRMKLELGPAVFAAQYQQEPSALASYFLQWHKVQRYREAPARERCLKVFQSWDTAFEDGPQSDYSVCTTWGFQSDKWYLLDLQRFRSNYSTLKDRVRALRDYWKAEVLVIEDAGSGKALLHDLRVGAQTGRDPGGIGVKLHAYKPTESKEARWAAQAAKLEDGSALLPQEAPWLEALRREVLSFPGRHDDQIDSIAQFLDYTRFRTGRTLMTLPDPSPVRRLPIHLEDCDEDEAALWISTRMQEEPRRRR